MSNAVRLLTRGAAVGAAVGLFVTAPWDVMFYGVDRPVLLIMGPLTVGFSLLGAFLGATLSLSCED
jgi:hypothetical protein